MAPKPKKHRRSKKSGLPPGALVYVGDREGEVLSIQRITQQADSVVTSPVERLADLAEWPSWTGLNWINIDGIHDVSLIDEIGRIFQIHGLILEDIVNSEQRPKVEEYADQVFLTMRMLDHRSTEGSETGEQISFILGPTFLLTFQERPGDIFDPIRERMKNPESRLRTRGNDYLLYALVDLIVDNYFLILENIGDELETIEEEFFRDQDSLSLQHLQQRKRELQQFRRVVNPLRDAIGTLYRDENPLITEMTRRYLSDVHDHLIQVQEILDTQREFCVELRETHLALLGNRTNEVMKVLTIIATIFIPLTFIVGVYGMNFTYMPELGWKWSYPLVWLIMVICALGLLRYFRIKKWL
ncbi:MAG: magnesium/cobalt transporter CorA [Lewinellaceae bacterium]|nr:magnesium/cobalt transporter CorA [Saprospiraceae bacterium]MCB9313051.1 magnesium/cobalt transporter CorA [Lewinellaceae bacterium]HRW75053.1 magnesium/cobalt transporter CorA [Saprospiraceae bacterium]